MKEIETFSRKLSGGSANPARVFSFPGPHNVKVCRSSVTCSCGYSRGTSTKRVAMHLAVTHVRDNLVWASSITDKKEDA